MNSPNVLTLHSCRPTPLSSYLKALGVFRVITGQADLQARGWWQADSFHLLTQLDQKSLLHFFLQTYSPTPIIAPWNGGSGFYPKDKKGGIEPLEASIAKRFAPFSNQIKQAREILGDVHTSMKGDAKEALIRECRRQMRGRALDWLEAAVVIAGDGSPRYPALLGTGGNDGRLDFTNNYMQRIAELYDVADTGEPKPETKSIIHDALFSDCAPILHSDKAIGQFSPGSAGGANATTGFSAKSLINPFDFILMLEGAIMFTAGLSRRCASHQLPQAAAPFAVRSRAVGYGSAAESEESARGEQWMPLWSNPLSQTELNHLIHEGRCTIGRQQAERPLDFARAIARMSVTRGITEFQRFGFLERNGQANFATPLGRWRVVPQPNQHLIDEVMPWLDTLSRAVKSPNPPAGIDRVARNCEEAVLSCCRNGALNTNWRHLFIKLGEAEAQLLRSPKFSASPEKKLRPLPRLNPDWLTVIGFDQVEVRLACSFAAQIGLTQHNQADSADEIRRHLTPLDESGYRFNIHNDSVDASPNTLTHPASFEQLAHFIINRRLFTMQRRGTYFPLLARHSRYATRLADINLFLNRQTDDAMLLALARSMTAIDWYRATDIPARPHATNAPGQHAIYAIIRLCHLPWPLDLNQGEPITIRTDPAIFQRMRSGNTRQAITTARRRLNVAGVRPFITHGIAHTAFSQRIAAALVFPVSRTTAYQIGRSLTYISAALADQPQ